MPEPSDPAAEVVRSWLANAEAWTAAVRSGGIASRRLATDEAVLGAVLERAPARVLDLGCGEGWLARALSARGVAVVGADASAPLIAAAQAAGGGTFLVRTYDELAADPAASGPASTWSWPISRCSPSTSRRCFGRCGTAHSPLAGRS